MSSCQRWASRRSRRQASLLPEFSSSGNRRPPWGRAGIPGRESGSRAARWCRRSRSDRPGRTDAARGSSSLSCSSGSDRLGRRLTVLDGTLGLRAEHLHLVHYDLRRVAAQAVLAIPFVTAQPALGIDQLAAGQEFLADRCQAIERNQRVILDVFLAVSVIVLLVAIGREPKLGDRQPFRTDHDLGIAGKKADEDDPGKPAVRR